MSSRFSFVFLFSILILLSGCSGLNPFCSSSRPAPVLTSISPTTVTLADVQTGFVLTLTGSKFVASTVVVINGTTMPTQVSSSTKMQVTVTSGLITAAGSASVSAHTPDGTSGNLGCDSGGNSAVDVLTIQ
jgi:hypothetical protein